MDNIMKTPYDWCVETKIRVLNDWPENLSGSGEKCFYEHLYTKEDFLSLIGRCVVKPNSQPRKTALYLEYRMYGLVAYNLSPIQQGIQFGHAVVDYGQKVRHNEKDYAIYNKWANIDKTFIILSGGGTNNTPNRLGMLNKHYLALFEAGILMQEFEEPDLGDQLTAFVFLVDERVFNKELYPDFVPETLPWSRNKPSEKAILALEERNTENYKHWVDKIGGEKNAFLRTYLKTLRLA